MNEQTLPSLTVDAPLVSVVMLNWNGFDDTVRCLESLNALTYPRFEVVLVDNGSADGSADRLPPMLGALPYPVELVLNPKNLGFAGGNAAALRRCKGEFIALLNNDTVVHKAWLSVLVHKMVADVRVAAAGGKAFVWNDDHPANAQSNPFYTYQEIDPCLAYAHTRMSGESPRYVDSISGCAVLLRKAALDEHGFLDRHFFAYYEETDLFARFLRSGKLIAYEPSAMIWHKIAASTDAASSFYSFYMQRNRAFFAVRNFDRAYLRCFLRSYLKNEAVFLAAHWWSRLRRLPPNEVLKTRARAFKSVLGHLPRLLVERRALVRDGHYNDRLSLLQAQSVSVIIANYNYARHVGEAIESVLAQTHGADEIIVVDDGSTDDSLSVIGQYDVTVVSQHNQGVVAAKNRGLKESRGRFVLFLDADDRLRPEAIAVYLRAIGARPDAGFAYSDAEYFGAQQGIASGRPFSARALVKANYIHNSSLMKREAIEAVGGYDPSLTQALEDWDLYMSLAEQGYKGIYVPEVLLDYRKHEVPSRNSANFEEDKAFALHAAVRRRHPRLDPLGQLRCVRMWRRWVSWRLFRDTFPLRPWKWGQIPTLVRLRLEERRKHPDAW